MTPQLNSQDSLINRDESNTKEYIDEQIGEIVRPGGLNYYQTGEGRGYQAVISTSPSRGAFTDIQTAINYVNSIGGGDILIYPGNYVVGTTITIPTNVSIRGIITEDTIIDFNNTSNGILFNGGDIKISNISIANSTGTTITIDSSGGIIDSCILQGNNVDIHINTGASRSRIVNNTSYFNTNRFLEIAGSLTDVLVQNNSYSGTGGGFIFGTGGYGGERIKFINNNFSQPGVPSFSGTSLINVDTATGWIFNGNTIFVSSTGTSADGIKLVNSTNNMIFGNLIVSGGGGTSYAINLSDSASGSNVVVGNVLGGHTAQVNNQGTDNQISLNAAAPTP